MLKFKDMWEDVNKVVNSKKNDFPIDNELESVFIIRDENDFVLLTKEDFVNLWTHMLLHNKCSVKDGLDKSDIKLYYMYKIMEQLPYVKRENEDIVLM